MLSVTSLQLYLLPIDEYNMITQKEAVSAIYNCVKEHEKSLIDEKAFLISLSVGIPIDDFYEVDGRLTYRGLVNGYVADCEKYLSVIDKYDGKTILNASLYMFNLIRRGITGKLDEKALKLLSELNLFQGYS
ncbi:hypothetical protein [Sulfurisphaera ohwakuensis]|uniref:Uncharacterized protein n=1 Tax=Sulfurisphaera ohwakuensis TaxID=69656 RepID=A0A650CIM3_SULOH|nr:hypothetical protein [Sulfurisphaera ohwakuensis]MBB5255262.1 hypothetical protein [Sulfurisphaera ohwakuensis]QGR17626.1 hypothetical protein D1869_10845 [Sulfurisphaera ohwakuensis]